MGVVWVGAFETGNGRNTGVEISRYFLGGCNGVL